MEAPANNLTAETNSLPNGFIEVHLGHRINDKWTRGVRITLNTSAIAYLAAMSEGCTAHLIGIVPNMGAGVHIFEDYEDVVKLLEAATW